MSSIRASASKLLDPFGKKAERKNPAKVQWLDSDGKTQTAGPAGNDWRLRVSVAPTSGLLYRDEDNFVLFPLVADQGVIFPITPTINVTHTAKYDSVSLTHSNYSPQFYSGSEVAAIQINGDFPIQNAIEGQYLLAAIYFFRAATKMFWGNDVLAGTPPPLLYLDGYGSHYFPHVPCVLTTFTHSLLPDVDYIEVPSAGDNSKITRVPTISSIQISLQPVYSRAKVSQFSAVDFARGDLIDKGFI